LKTARTFIMERKYIYINGKKSVEIETIKTDGEDGGC
jgi:hypothetical protein